MKDFYITFLEDIHTSPKTWEEIREKFPNEQSAIGVEVKKRNLLSQYKDGKWYLSFEARFKLLDYYELQEAKRAAKESSLNAQIARIQTQKAIKEAQKSNRLAWNTIKISVSALILGILVNLFATFYQVNSPIALTEDTIQAMNSRDH